MKKLLLGIAVACAALMVPVAAALRVMNHMKGWRNPL